MEILIQRGGDRRLTGECSTTSLIMEKSFMGIDVSRTDLRNLMLNSLEAGTVQWGHGIESTRVVDKSTYEISFQNPSYPPVQTNLLIGGDGTFSRIRPPLHDTKPPYAGLTMFDLPIDASSMSSKIRSLVGGGSAMILGGDKAILPQMNSGGKCRVYATLKCSERWLSENPLPEDGKREWICGHFKGWCEGTAEEMIMASDEALVVPRRIYNHDADLSWDSDLTGVTVMGEPTQTYHDGECTEQRQVTLLMQCLHSLEKVSIRVSPFSSIKTFLDVTRS